VRLVVTGASSFVGAHFCRRAARRHEVFALYHRTPIHLSRVTPLRCDLRHSMAADRVRAAKPDVVVHLACKVMGSGAPSPNPVEALNRRMMDIVLAQEVPVLYASSTVVHWPGDSGYGRGRKEDEARLAESGRPWAVVRPSAPYGPALLNHQPRHKESFHTLAELVTRLPVVPLPGGGSARRQPVHVDDLSDAMLALIEGGLPNAAYDAGGPEPITLAEIAHAIARAAGKEIRILPLPASLMARLAKLRPDMDEELVSQSASDEVVDPRPLMAASGVTPRPFKAGVSDLLQHLR